MPAARSEWMLYGAYGRTGRLILDEPLRRGYKPVLAGRNASQLAAVGRTTAAVEAQLEDPRVGALTPVQAFGADFALLAPGTRIQEL